MSSLGVGEDLSEGILKKVLPINAELALPCSESSPILLISARSSVLSLGHGLLHNVDIARCTDATDAGNFLEEMPSGILKGDNRKFRGG